MTWSVLFRLRRYLRESLWVAPLVGGVVGWTLGIASSDFGTIASLPVRWQYSPSTAESVLDKIGCDLLIVKPAGSKSPI